MKLQSEEPAYDQLIQLMEVFSGDKDLLNWFYSLQSMSVNVRSLHLRSIADGLRTNRERPDLIEAVESLASPKLFQSAVKTIQSFDH
jgi:hypothetical protein